MKIESNNLYLGDCYELIKELPDKSIDLVYIDIPYEFVGSGGAGAFGKRNRNYHDEYLKVSVDPSVSKLGKRKAASSSALNDIAHGLNYHKAGFKHNENVRGGGACPKTTTDKSGNFP